MEEEDLDDFEDFPDLDEERLPRSSGYVLVCLLLPFLAGNLAAFAWPGFSLYYESMGWPAVNTGLAVTAGFALRVVCQQLPKMLGFWVAVPFAVIHTVIAVLALLFITKEWAILLEAIAFICFEPLAMIEGIAFDVFGSSELLARQATSTVLSVYTLSKAIACTLGGIVYENFGWEGIVVYHLGTQSTLLLTFLVQPSCRQSFMKVFFEAGTSDESEVQKVTKADESRTDEIADSKFAAAVPASSSPKQSTKLPGSVEELKLNEAEHGKDTVTPDRTSKQSRGTAHSGLDDHRLSHGTATGLRARHTSEDFVRDSVTLDRKSKQSRGTARIGLDDHRRSKGTARLRSRAGSGDSPTRQSRRSYQSRASVASALSRMSRLSVAGHELRHSAMMLEATVITAKGDSGRIREETNPERQHPDLKCDEEAPKKKGIPKDLRLRLKSAPSSQMNLVGSNSRT